MRSEQEAHEAGDGEMTEIRHGAHGGRASALESVPPAAARRTVLSEPTASGQAAPPAYCGGCKVRLDCMRCGARGGVSAPYLGGYHGTGEASLLHLIPRPRCTPAVVPAGGPSFPPAGTTAAANRGRDRMSSRLPAYRRAAMSSQPPRRATVPQPGQARPLGSAPQDARIAHARG